MTEGIAHMPTQAEREFPVVGVGASAGGLEAISSLLEQLPSPCGMALLVVQHLDPHHPSLLTEILSKRTTLPVEQATDEMPIAVDHVYVIPPNTSMSVMDGFLRLKPRGDGTGPAMPIDDLFESLAKDRGADAIGVILSGTGTDGAIGMQAIKGCGGITLAQDEHTARFSAMPRAAIGLGVIDKVLAPSAIAAELLRIVHHPYLATETLENDGLRRVLREIRYACNIDFTHYKRGTIARRTARRMALRGAGDVAAYLCIMGADSSEVHALCRDLLIRYTEFFRDSDAFAALTESALPRLLKGPDPAASLRIWVPGCATGEEVYSIAICVAEYLARHALMTPVQIFGTDISDEALATARGGRYIENIARNVSPERLNRFFVKEGDGYRVIKSIRDWCTFARQDIAYDPPFSRIGLISCRNLLIYLDTVLHKRVLPALHFALQPEGLLMLGLSETIGGHGDLFSAMDIPRGKLFVKKAVPSRSFGALSMPAVRAQLEAGNADGTAGNARGAAAAPSHADIDRILLARYTPACVLCDEDFNVLEYRGDTGPFLIHPAGVPTNQLRRLARPNLLLAITDAARQLRAGVDPVVKEGLRVEVDGQPREARLEMTAAPRTGNSGRWFIVVFMLTHRSSASMAAGTAGSLRDALKATLVASLNRRAAAPPDAAMQGELARLIDELRSTRQQMRALIDEHAGSIEELRAFEEETLASNEEFQSTNEELETTKEELQSLNEELSTTNDELRFRHRELKTVHDQATQARDYADAIVETVSQPLLVLDAEFRVVRANTCFYESFHTRASETLNASLYALGSGQWDIPALRALLEDLLPRHSRVRNHEVTATFPQLGVRTMRLNASQVSWPDSALILLSIDDVTARGRAFAQLVVADRQKDEFLAMLAHELRNPLAVMSNAAHLMQHERASPEIKANALATIERQLRIQVRMVDDLLEVSRITRGVVALQVQRVDVAQIVRQAHEGQRQPIALRGHEVNLVLPTDGVFVDADAARIEQVVTNLLANAVKYTPAGGRIEVHLEQQHSHAVLTLSDNGIGMTAEFLPQIFTVFVQAETSIQRSTGGLGVGLAIVRRLVELHGGTVEAHSDGLNHGSRFIVRLPAAQRSARAPAANDALAPSQQPSADTPKRRVLVVDDNPDAAQGAAALLALDGHDVRVVADGPAALREVQRFLPEVVLLDIGLAGMSGYDVCRQILRLPNQQNTVVLAVSGYGQSKDIEEARRAGFNDHITKPARPHQLERYLRGAA
jgi:two-component system, chemotaxis family, CheB/CheR fusion protein